MQEEVEAYSHAELSRFRCVDGRYRVLAPLGRGRYGQVHAAFDACTRQIVALKEPLDLGVVDRLENFLSEVSKLVYLREHAQSVAVTQIRDFKLEVGQGEAVAYYTMDFALLGELFGFLEHTPPIGEDSGRFFFTQLVEAVAGIHSLGLAHLDLKPENVLLRPDSSLLLCDFGSATWSAGGHAPSYAGSREYCAPEALPWLDGDAAPEGHLDFRRLDSFALGVLLFVALFKSNPFMSASPSDPYYHTLLTDSEAFWEIFAPINAISHEAKHFLEELLLTPPAQRPLAESLLRSRWVNELPANPGFRDALRLSLKAYRQMIEADLLAEVRRQAKRRPASGKAEQRPRGRQAAEATDTLRRFLRQNEERVTRLRKTLDRLTRGVLAGTQQSMPQF